MADDKEIKALLQLLDDPNDEVFEHVSENILKQGENIIPELEKVWEKSLNAILQERIENLIQEIQFSSTQKQLKEWKESGAVDLLKAAYLIAKYQYPDLKYNDIIEAFNKIKRDAWLEINNNLTALEKTRILNHILFQVHKFSGNSSNFFAPQNSYINHVFDTKKGNPLTLGIIYISLAQELNIPIYGVSMPRNFILAYIDEYNIHDPYKDDVLFYINPYNNGKVLGEREIDYFLKQQKIESKKSYYSPCSNIEIIKKLILNLIYSYEKLGYPEKVNDMKKLFNIVN
ncbi:MAG: transglutaminase-like domain-containing protein [Bacteroidales bacterium]|nr:transglutaminase-like domain-containing protein [Bacteroidales bacterium]